MIDSILDSLAIAKERFLDFLEENGDAICYILLTIGLMYMAANGASQ